MAHIRQRGKSWLAEVFKLGVRDARTFDTHNEAEAWAKLREDCIKAGTKPRSIGRRRKVVDYYSLTPPKIESEGVRLEALAASATPVPSYPGIYFLFIDTDLVYIGESRNALERIAEHARRGRAFNRYAVLPAPADAKQRKAAECEFIKRFNPIGNRIVQHQPVVPASAPQHLQVVDYM